MFVMARGQRQLLRPLSQRGPPRLRRVHQRRQQRCVEIARRGFRTKAHQIVAKLLQGIDQAHQGPVGQWRGKAAPNGARHTFPGITVDAVGGHRSGFQDLAAGRCQQDVGSRQGLPGQPVERLGYRRQSQAQALATAAHGRQQCFGIVRSEHQAQTAGRLFQRLQQRVGGNRVHGLRRMDQDHLAARPR